MIATDKGDFLTLAHLRYAYLKHFEGNPRVHEFTGDHGFDLTTLHISELGKCPRQQMLRLLKTEPYPKGLDRLANEELMYWQGNQIHALTVGALSWAGILHSYEESLDLPDGWSGHYDALFWDSGTLCGLDNKTKRSNAFNYSFDWPKIEESWQMWGYLAFLPQVMTWYIEYIDRGGAKTPQYRIVSRNDSAVGSRMGQLDQYRSYLPDLPSVLLPEYKIYYRKVTNEPVRRYNSINVGPSWQCEWCPYLYGQQHPKTGEWTVNSDSPCKPNMEKLQVGKTEKNVFKCIAPQHEETLTLWLKAQVLEYPIEEEDVD